MAVCFDDQSLTLDEILSRHGLKPTDLDNQCPLEVRNDVAVRITDWEMVGYCFNFTPEKIRDIKSDSENEEQCKIALLNTWSKREGKGATYLKLADVFHRRNCRDLVEFLCEKIKLSMRLVPLAGAPDTSWDIVSTVKSHLVSVTEGYSDTVSSQIESLEEQFDNIHSRLVTELTEGGTSVEQVLQALTKLPFAFRKQYQDIIKAMLPDLETKDLISSLFHLLDPLFTFIDYDLLRHLVAKFGSTTLKEDMSVYIEKVQLFKKATTVSELIDYWPGLEVPMSNYSRLRAKIGDDPRTYTLEELDNFRRKFFSHLKLSDFISVSILMLLEHTNSFIATWLIPTVIIPGLIEVFHRLHSSFVWAEHILELSVDERTLFQRNESVYMTPLDKTAVKPISAPTHVKIPSQHPEDAIYCLLVSKESTSEVTHIYIAACIRNTAMKIMKLQRKRNANIMIKRFRFKMGDRAPCLQVRVGENAFITEIEPRDGMIRASDVWRQQEGLQNWLDRYHLKITMNTGNLPVFNAPPIQLKGSIDDSQLVIPVDIGKMQTVMDNYLVSGRSDPLSQQLYEDIQFGYHSATGKEMRITSDGLGAEKINADKVYNNGVVYGAHPLKGRAEFEVKIVSCRGMMAMSLQLGVMRCKKDVHVDSGYGIPIDSFCAVNHCVWAGKLVSNKLFASKLSRLYNYGYIDLHDLRAGDCAGICLSQDGMLEFTVNGESQGIAAKNVYIGNSDVYAVIDHFGNCAATLITKAVTQYNHDINLEDLCLNKLFSLLKNGKEVDRLPLPTRLKHKLKLYFSV